MKLTAFLRGPDSQTDQSPEAPFLLSVAGVFFVTVGAD
jgi:hypothetical protein